MPVRTKAWEDALAFQSGWKRLGISPRSARAGTEEASTADSVSRKSILLYYTLKQNYASVVNKTAAYCSRKTDRRDPLGCCAGFLGSDGDRHFLCCALSVLRKWTKPYPAFPRRPPDNQVGCCQSGRLVLRYYREDHLLQGQPRRGKRDQIQGSPAAPDRVPVLTATGDRATSPCSSTGTSVVSAHWGDGFRLR